MKARDAFLLVVLGIVLTVSVGGYLYYENSIKKDDSNHEANKAANAEKTPATPTKQSSSAGSDNSRLQVMGANDTAPANASQQLPGPEEFGQYDKYVNEQNILYVDVVKGNGEEAKTDDVAAMLYKGWLTDGQLFDQTKKNEQGQMQAFSFQLGARQVIGGWEQGIAGMKVGGKRRLVIPPSLGYGAQGQGPIPPNAVLVFDVELVALNPEQSGQGL